MRHNFENFAAPALPRNFLMFGPALVFVLAALVPNTALSAAIAAVVSSRNAADVVTGAHQFLQSYPANLLKLKTNEQFLEMSQQAQKQWLESADIVFVGGVFAAAGENILAASKAGWLQNFIAVHSDRRLVGLSRLAGKVLLTDTSLDQLMVDPPVDGDSEFWTARLLEEHSAYRPWLMTRLFWSGRSTENITSMFAHLANLAGETIAVPAPVPSAPVRTYYRGSVYSVSKLSELLNRKDRRWVVILDYETGSRLGAADLHRSLCGQTQNADIDCVSLFATWGDASVAAVDMLQQNRSNVALIVSFQNFVTGGGEGRAEVNSALARLGVPVLKGIRLSDRTEQMWRLSEDGVAWDSVHYRVAMSEIQGIAEPTVPSVNTVPRIDELTGIRVTQQSPLGDQTKRFVRRIKKWIALQRKSNAEKKIAVIYYNHPPGRHKIGADNLNVPSTVFELLHKLKFEGYELDSLPESEAELLDLLQERAVNLPDDSGGKIARQLSRRVIEDLRHVVDGADHPARQRVLNLIDHLDQEFAKSLKNVGWEDAQKLVEAIAASGIEGLRGWGRRPDR